MYGPLDSSLRVRVRGRSPQISTRSNPTLSLTLSALHEIFVTDAC